jgi:hypothetical protein
LKQFTQRGLAVTRIADRQIEHEAEEFSLVVIGNAALGAAVVVKSLKPRAKAGVFGGLRQVCGTMLEFTDLRTKIR